MHKVLSDDQVQGGGPIIDIVSRSVHNGKVDSQKERLKDLEAKVAKLEKELSCRKTSEHSELPPRNTTPKSQNALDQSSASTNQRPESLLQNFMMHDFVGAKLFDNLIIPGAVRLKKENQVPKN